MKQVILNQTGSSRMWSTHTVAIGKVFKQRLPRADFVLDPPHSPIFTEDVDPLGGEGPVLGGPRVHEQVVGLAPAVVQLRAHVSKQGRFSTCGGGAGPVGVRAAGAVRLQGVRGPFILENLLQHPAAVPRSHSEPHPLLGLVLPRRQHRPLHGEPSATLHAPHSTAAPCLSFRGKHAAQTHYFVSHGLLAGLILAAGTDLKTTERL